MEWLCEKRPTSPVTAVLFDFDGTISTLRCGWEKVMEPLMVELLGEVSRDVVRAYIGESTGIQTIFQMKWLADMVNKRNPGTALDPWSYKAEYNRRLMESVMKRRMRLRYGRTKTEEYMIAGSREMLEMLKYRGVSLYVASGTDDADVKQEVAELGLSVFFDGIMGAPEGREDCSKEAVIRDLIEKKGIPGERLAIVGDGKVEITIGRENNARALGVASDERALIGVDPIKRGRLIRAGADAVVGDFREIESLKAFFFGEAR